MGSDVRVLIILNALHVASSIARILLMMLKLLMSITTIQSAK